MPRFETNGEIEIKITPQEFYDACSLSEENALCDIIMDEYDLVYNEKTPHSHQPSTRSYSESKFYENLAILEENWLTMDVNDAKIIAVLAEKYS